MCLYTVKLDWSKKITPLCLEILTTVKLAEALPLIPVVLQFHAEVEKRGEKYFLSVLFHCILDVCMSIICVGLGSRKYLTEKSRILQE